MTMSCATNTSPISTPSSGTCVPWRGPLKINDEVLLRWIRTFSTARVGIAQWLGIVDETSASMVEESAAQGILAPQYGVYEWLGYVTEFLVEMLQQDG